MLRMHGPRDLPHLVNFWRRDAAGSRCSNHSTRMLYRRRWITLFQLLYSTWFTADGAVCRDGTAVSYQGPEQTRFEGQRLRPNRLDHGTANRLVSLAGYVGLLGRVIKQLLRRQESRKMQRPRPLRLYRMLTFRRR